SPAVKVDGATLSIQGILPSDLSAADSLAVSADVLARGTSAENADVVASHPVKLSGWHSPEVDLSTVKPQDGPFPIVYEAFHYAALPNPRDLTCTVIKALGDKF